MHEITVALSDDTFERVKILAERNHLDAEVLLRVGIDDWLDQVAPTFEEAAAYVLKKNEELYDRLAK